MYEKQRTPLKSITTDRLFGFFYSCFSFRFQEVSLICIFQELCKGKFFQSVLSLALHKAFMNVLAATDEQIMNHKIRKNKKYKIQFGELKVRPVL